MRFKVLFVLIVSLAFGANLRAATVTLQPGHEGVDLWITDTFSYGSDYGVDDDKLQVGGWGDQYFSLIKFDLTNAPAHADSAILQLYSFSTQNDGTYTGMYLDRLTSAWNEDIGWYNGKPSFVSQTQLPAPQPNQWYSIDVTSLYNGWKSGQSNYGIQLRPIQWCCHNSANFRSSDYVNSAYRPKLVITYSDAFKIAFPLKNGTTAFTAPVSAIFDQARSTGDNNRDGVIKTYDGTEWKVGYGCLAYVSAVDVRTCNANNYQTMKGVVGFRNSTQTKFRPPFNYQSGVNGNDATYVFYDGHTGYDYPVPDNTPVYADFGGTVSLPHDAYNTLVIDHKNGYFTYYLHMSSFVPGIDGSTVVKGARVGSSGHFAPTNIGPHLHVTIKKLINGSRVQIDPYRDPDGKSLWE
jgi:hypothetical protein